LRSSLIFQKKSVPKACTDAGSITKVPKLLKLLIIIHMDIIKILNEFSKNEQEDQKVFRKWLVEYCTNPKHAVATLFRLLKSYEMVLSDYLEKNNLAPADRQYIGNALEIIRIELEIIR